MPDEPKVPLGKPLDLTDAELDALAKVTPEDVRKERETWNKQAPEKFDGLLEPILLDIEEG